MATRDFSSDYGGQVQIDVTDGDVSASADYGLALSLAIRAVADAVQDALAGMASVPDGGPTDLRIDAGLKATPTGAITISSDAAPIRVQLTWRRDDGTDPIGALADSRPDL
jgi:hypothetical protein